MAVAEVAFLIGQRPLFTGVAGCSPIREGVLLIRPDTTLADVRKFGEECQRRWGITPLQIFLHKDEGHWLNGQPKAEDNPLPTIILNNCFISSFILQGHID